MGKNKNNITVKTQNGISINAPNVSQPQSSTIQSAPARLNNTFNNINSGPPNNTVVTPLNSNNQNANQNANQNPNSDPYNIFYNAIKKLYHDYLTDPITHTLTGCDQLYPNKPGYSRGWIFNGLIPTFAPCGCYYEAVWPVFLNVGLFTKAVAKKFIVSSLRRQCLTDFLLTVSQIVASNRYIAKSWRAIQTLGVDSGIPAVTNRLTRILNVPPVQPGFRRLYRAQDNGRLAFEATLNDPEGVGCWFAENIQVVLTYISQTVHNVGTPFLGRYPKGHIVYVDIPNDLVDGFTLARRQNIEDYIIDQTTDPIQKELLKKQSVFHLAQNVEAFDPSTGKTVVANQTRYSDWEPKMMPNGQMGPGKKIPVRRKNANGDIEWIYDYPKESDTLLNPSIHTSNNSTAKDEMFVSATVANNAKKIASCPNLGDVKEFQDLIKKINDFTLFEGSDISILPEALPPNSSLNRQTLLQQSGYQAGERWLSDASYRAQKAAEWKKIVSEFQALKAKHLDELPLQLQETIDTMETLMDANSPLIKKTNFYINLLGFIINVLDVTTVVENKKCGPKYYMHSGISDVLRFIGAGLIGSTYVPPQSRIRDSDWDLIRNKLIQDEARIFWAELDDNCDCNSCPENYNLCDKPINFFTDYYNTCQRCQECLNDNFEPIYAENSTKPILLSDKSIQSYRPLPATGNVFDPETGLAIKDDGCICECEASNIIRRDKDNKLVSRGRKLKDYRPNTGNPFEDSNCYSYTDGPNKVNINIIRNQNSNQGGIATIDPNLIIPPNIGQLIPAIPYETIQNRQVCDLSTPPDGLPEFPKFSLFSSAISAYRWDSVLGMWQCKKIKGCLSPLVFTHGVASNGEYCDCTNMDLSSSSSSSSEIVEPGSFFGCNFESATVNGQYNYFEIHNSHSAYNNGDNIIFYKDANGWVITPFVFDDSDIYNSDILYKNTNENVISSSWINLSSNLSSSSSQILSSGITQIGDC